MLRVGGEAAEVAVVDADHIHLGADVPQLVGRVQLQEHLQPEPMRHVGQLATSVGRERGGDEQHGVGADDTRLIELVGVDDEVFAEDGQVGQRTDGAEVADGAAEELLVREHGEGGGASAGIVGHDVGRVGLAGDPAFRRRSAFELGNDARGRFGQGAPHGVRRPWHAVEQGFFKLFLGDDTLADVDLEALVGDDLGEDVLHLNGQWLWVPGQIRRQPQLPFFS